tara:strand:- start:858 stop:1133 length:276 start_codon:yes stop_codon:yes gene_type:complete
MDPLLQPRKNSRDFKGENSNKKLKPIEKLHQGDCVNLNSDQGTFQVIGIDDQNQKCWVRKWPLPPKGSPVFEISMRQIADLSAPKPYFHPI